MADLQELVDDLAAEIQRPISVEDRRWRLLAHSAHTGATDTVRSTTILTRAAPPAVAAWLESLGVLSARELVEVPPNDELEMAARVVMPVRHGDVLLGFVWVVVGERPLSGGERAALERVAAATQAILWERRTQFESQQHLLRTLLFDEDAAAVRHAALELRIDDGPVAVVVAEGGEEAGEHARRHAARGLVWALEPPGLVAVAGGAPQELAGRLAQAGSPRAAAAGAPDLQRARTGLRRAQLARLAQRAEPALGAAVAFEAIGAWAQVTELWDSAGRPPAPPEVLALAEHHHGEELIEGVEAMLEAGGDVAAAATSLHVHRATLYRRLQRAQEASGLDLSRGDDRLLAQLGLRIWRLRQLSQAGT